MEPLGVHLQTTCKRRAQQPADTQRLMAGGGKLHMLDETRQQHRSRADSQAATGAMRQAGCRKKKERAATISPPLVAKVVGERGKLAAPGAGGLAARQLLLHQLDQQLLGLDAGHLGPGRGRGVWAGARVGRGRRGERSSWGRQGETPGSVRCKVACGLTVAAAMAAHAGLSALAMQAVGQAARSPITLAHHV